MLLGGTRIGWYGVTVATLAGLTACALNWEGQGTLIVLMVAGGAVVHVTAAVAAWGSSEAGWFIPPVVGIVVAVAGVLPVQRNRRPVSESAPT